jgi:hypothetical protein
MQGARSISFKQFMAALPLLAAARGCDVAEVGRPAGHSHGQLCLLRPGRWTRRARPVRSGVWNPPTRPPTRPFDDHKHPFALSPTLDPHLTVQVRMLVAAAGGPVRRGTTPLAVRFHDEHQQQQQQQGGKA